VGSNLVPSKILKGNAADAEYMARKISEFNPSSIKKKKRKYRFRPHQKEPLKNMFQQ